MQHQTALKQDQELLRKYLDVQSDTSSALAQREKQISEAQAKLLALENKNARLESSLQEERSLTRLTQELASSETQKLQAQIKELSEVRLHMAEVRRERDVLQGQHMLGRQTVTQLTQSLQSLEGRLMDLTKQAAAAADRTTWQELARFLGDGILGVHTSVTTMRDTLATSPLISAPSSHELWKAIGHPAPRPATSWDPPPPLRSLSPGKSGYLASPTKLERPQSTRSFSQSPASRSPPDHELKVLPASYGARFASSADRMFDALDSNHDGVLSRQEFEAAFGSQNSTAPNSQLVSSQGYWGQAAEAALGRARNRSPVTESALDNSARRLGELADNLQGAASSLQPATPEREEGGTGSSWDLHNERKQKHARRWASRSSDLSQGETGPIPVSPSTASVLQAARDMIRRTEKMLPHTPSV